MAYRIHFTLEDLARTRVAREPAPLFELNLAARVLQDRSQPVRLDAWRRHTLSRLTAPQRTLLTMMPPVGWSASFLGNARSGPAEELLERLRATPVRHIRSELAMLAEQKQPLPAWARHLADDNRLRQEMYDALAGLYETLLKPHWDRLAARYNTDRIMRMRHFSAGGIERVLAQANPRWMRWNPPVLEIQMRNNVDFDLHLEGQGILLVPSLWWTRTIVENEALPQPSVSYPAGDTPLDQLTSLAPAAWPPGRPEAVTKLLGRTRAAVLTAIAEHPGCSTKQLAVLAHVAESGASEHATVLREAGLIVTLRPRNTAHHIPTALGLALLNNQPTHSPSPAGAEA
ncbi:helix-turn-helix domain-containing protein [Actinoplanes sp. NPDC051411]|uniref:winged helix-turn-helix domain-containing protein n=1 Tax=Actinoplanes sp. NPDC051411 TaxID=3155522 RepID=UPI00342F2352